MAGNSVKSIIAGIKNMQQPHLTTLDMGTSFLSLKQPKQTKPKFLLLFELNR